MPTWRNWLGREKNHLSNQIDFYNTNFYMSWNSLLNNQRFINYIENNNIEVLFYPHINMQKYLNQFKSASSNIKLMKTSNDIQEILKESKILITDYSSVYMDFAYMQKPVIYYQFDYQEYREKQYQDGYFDYQKDGFGPVVKNQNELVDLFINIYEQGVEKKYIDRMNNFFELKDQKNSQRIYELLKK